MSKKTKRLEKENLNLTRKQEATNKNIFQMAEERSQSQQNIDRLSRENEKLKKLCRAMQTGGYGSAAPARALSPAHNGHTIATFDTTESEYEDDDDEEYDEDEDGDEEYDDDTEEEGIDVQPRTYGPPPPPPPQNVAHGRDPHQLPPQQQQLPPMQVNGTSATVNVNGSRH